MHITRDLLQTACELQWAWLHWALAWATLQILGAVYPDAAKNLSQIYPEMKSLWDALWIPIKSLYRDP